MEAASPWSQSRPSVLWISRSIDNRLEHSSGGCLLLCACERGLTFNTVMVPRKSYFLTVSLSILTKCQKTKSNILFELHVIWIHTSIGIIMKQNGNRMLKIAAHSPKMLLKKKKILLILLKNILKLCKTDMHRAVLLCPNKADTHTNTYNRSARHKKKRRAPSEPSSFFRLLTPLSGPQREGKTMKWFLTWQITEQRCLSCLTATPDCGHVRQADLRWFPPAKALPVSSLLTEATPLGKLTHKNTVTWPNGNSSNSV